jgi:hypothetical protein
MERPEVPLEQAQEDIAHHAHAAAESWIMGVALTAAVLAVLAAITALFAEHFANEAMILQIRSSDQWAYYQAKGVKAAVTSTRIDVLTVLGKAVGDKDREQLAKYEREQAKIKKDAGELQHESEAYLARHLILARSLTMFQIGIAVAAIAVLTKLKGFWLASLALGVAGIVQIAWGLLL